MVTDHKTDEKSMDEKVDEMTSGTDQAHIHIEEDAVHAAENAAGDGLTATILGKLTERIGANSGASAVFGEPVERDGRTIIPVAQSMWGSGAGSGESEEMGTGAGGGGGAMSGPLGFIEVTGDKAEFVPLHKPWQDPKLILAYAFAIMIVVRSLNRLLRG